MSDNDPKRHVAFHVVLQMNDKEVKLELKDPVERLKALKAKLSAEAQAKLEKKEKDRAAKELKSISLELPDDAEIDLGSIETLTEGAQSLAQKLQEAMSKLGFEDMTEIQFPELSTDTLPDFIQSIVDAFTQAHFIIKRFKFYGDQVLEGTDKKWKFSYDIDVRMSLKKANGSYDKIAGIEVHEFGIHVTKDPVSEALAA